LGLLFVQTTGLKVFLVLGCNMGWLQQDRVSAALEYWEANGGFEDSIWYLSGGVKDALKNKISQSEAEQMSSRFKSANLDIVLDTSATNTAENFRNFSKFISKLGILSDLEIIIVTSRFHKDRAEKFFYGFFSQNVIPKWVLAPLECPTCARDELFHMRNVEADISKALILEQEFLN
jgi:uncharacterized SAM-binding protein YcdF (DUF218 family)